MSAFLYAMLKKGVNVYLKTENGVCSFGKICESNHCEKGCNSSCEIDEESPYILISDLIEFLNLLKTLYIIIITNKEFPWFENNHIMGMFNNATSYDLKHPELFIEKVIQIIAHSQHVLPGIVGNLGEFNLSRGDYNVFIRTEYASACQESPLEFIINLTNDGTISELNEAHRVRYSILDDTTVEVTSVQASQLEYSKKSLSSNIERIFNTISDIFNFEEFHQLYKVLNRYLPEDVRNIFIEYSLVNAQLDLKSEDEITEFISRFRTIILKYLAEIKKIKLLGKSLDNAFSLFLSMISIFIQESNTIDKIIDTQSSYKQREDNLKVLNPEMRLRSHGHLSSENVSGFSLITFISYIRQLGFKTLRIPLSYPFRDIQRLNRTVDYIHRKKEFLVQRIALELGIPDEKVSLVEDGSCYIIDISEVSFERPILSNLNQRMLG